MLFAEATMNPTNTPDLVGGTDGCHCPWGLCLLHYSVDDVSMTPEQYALARHCAQTADLHSALNVASSGYREHLAQSAMRLAGGSHDGAVAGSALVSAATETEPRSLARVRPHTGLYQMLYAPPFLQDTSSVAILSSQYHSGLNPQFSTLPSPGALNPRRSDPPVANNQFPCEQASAVSRSNMPLVVATGAQAVGSTAPSRKAFNRKAYAPKNRSRGFKPPPPIQFWSNGRKGILLADVRKDWLHNLEGAGDPAFEKVSAKKHYHIEVRTDNLPPSPCTDVQYESLTETQYGGRAYRAAKNARVREPGRKYQSIHRAKVAKHVVEVIDETGLREQFDEGEMNRLVLLEVHHATQGTLVPILGWEEDNITTH
ncbi:hypothetical protein NM688_g6355 [Phlebia brevispora]|uniref:Uncharacterized protein n=1 Tax=Phlebia brevispora TaxID=194682 RepID=A0ACC1SGX8_9APHY|nr:hypothetical protein NM688_g6355 [Phlebia brevispora]